jgi:hypothetical protein
VDGNKGDPIVGAPTHLPDLSLVYFFLFMRVLQEALAGITLDQANIKNA